MKTTKITDNLFWVGAVDWDLRDFHGYQTEKGSTYNAYLLKDDKTVLLDTVKSGLEDDLIRNIKEVSDLDKIDYIVCNHAEMDHTGSLPKIMELVKPEKLITNAKGKDTLIEHFGDLGWPIEVIKEGDTIETGSRTIRFLGTPMLHWPESMASYIEEDQALVSNDIFGQHWATSERFDDEVDYGELMWQSAKYFANIFLPTAGAARKMLSKLEDQKIDPKLILVDHGLIWREHVSEIIEKYKFWGEQRFFPKAVVVYDTMWGSTSKIARAIGRGLSAEGVSVKLFDLRFNHRSDIITEMLDARAVVLGSSVLNKQILPKMADMLSYMKSLNPGNKIGAAFGSYGWQDAGVKKLNAAMEELKFDIVEDGISFKYVPSEENLSECEKFGERIRKAVLS